MITEVETALPEITECLNLVSDTAWRNQDWQAAIRAAKLALEVDPSNIQASQRLGRSYLRSGNADAAVNWFSHAFLSGAKDPATCVNLALAYTNLRDYSQALYCCAAALVEDPTFQPAFIQQGAIYEQTSDWESQAQVYQEGLRHHPGNKELEFAMATNLLAAGKYRRGWNLYESRPGRQRLLQQIDEYPEWRGEELSGKTLLVVREQGFGDALFFSRWLRALQGRAQRIVVYTYPEIVRLLAFNLATTLDFEWITCDQELATVEPDYWVGMGSLPQFLQTDRPAAYLGVQNLPGKDFSDLIPESGCLKVGLCWRGNPNHGAEPARRIPWEQMKRLLDVHGCDFYSLTGSDQGETRESGLVNLTEYVHDVADTAAAIARLDLVITSCTMIAHLAGTMGKPVWVLLNKPCYWLWGRSGATTPWYPSAYLIRSSESYNWEWIVGYAKQKLEAMAKDRPVQTSAEQAESVTERFGYRVSGAGGGCRYGQMTWPLNDRWVGRSLELYGEFSESELTLLRKVLNPGDTVVECGAEVGGLTVGLADAVGPAGRVYAFEPQPHYVSCLSQNATGKPVVVIAKAAGAEETVIALRHVETRKVHAHGMGSEQEPFGVEQISIDSLALNSCALLKIDVDGMEHEILKGAAHTIQRCRPVIYVEYDKPERYPELLAWLLARNYRLYQHDAPLYNRDNFRGNRVNVFGNLISRMILCVPNERKDLRFPSLPRLRAEKEQ